MVLKLNDLLLRGSASLSTRSSCSRQLSRSGSVRSPQGAICERGAHLSPSVQTDRHCNAAILLHVYSICITNPALGPCPSIDFPARLSVPVYRPGLHAFLEHSSATPLATHYDQTYTPSVQNRATSPRPANPDASRPVPSSGRGFLDFGSLPLAHTEQRYA